MTDINETSPGAGRNGILSRLARDRRGNVLAMSAAAVVPIIAMVGGAVDVGRIYMAQTRLQQACDAGALAGRRAMANVTTLTSTEQQKAEQFFDFNFPAGTYEVATPVRSYARGAVGVVTGTASATLPTTVMKIFGYTDVPIAVTCQSTLSVPNTDVMFVLDVTGSMADTPSSDTIPKIAGLRQAVKDFYGALGPGTTTGAGRIRYGFVPYSSNVNVGQIVKALDENYITGGTTGEAWTYQTRVAQTTPDRYIESYGAESSQINGTSSDSTISWGAWNNQTSAMSGYTLTYSNVSSSTCNGYATPPAVDQNSGNATGPTYVSEETVVYPDATQTRNYTGSQGKTRREYDYVYTATSGNRGTCQLKYRNGTFTRTTPSTTTRPANWATRDKFTGWSYQQASLAVSDVVRNGVMNNPAYYTGYYTGANPNGSAPVTIGWGGCIEEANTVNTIVAGSSLSVPSGASDLQIDLRPNSAETRWKPFLRDVQYDRSGNWLGRNSGWIDSGFAACPREASALTQYTTDYVTATKSSATFNTYVDSLAPIGGTYHDIGLIWGARFLSPDGIFSATNSDSTAPGGYQISRHIVFMTDGTLDTRANANDPWGINTLDGRIAATSANNAAMNASHLRRTEIICNAMKGKGFTIWVLGFGIATLPTELANCASDANHASVSTNSAQLRTRFQTIAETIGGLRLSQ